jgi:transposase
VKRGKNDAADAEALCEAVTRPNMRSVPVKSKKRQAACMLMTAGTPGQREVAALECFQELCS